MRFTFSCTVYTHHQAGSCALAKQLPALPTRQANTTPARTEGPGVLTKTRTGTHNNLHAALVGGSRARGWGWGVGVALRGFSALLQRPTANRSKLPTSARGHTHTPFRTLCPPLMVSPCRPTPGVREPVHSDTVVGRQRKWRTAEHVCPKKRKGNCCNVYRSAKKKKKNTGCAALKHAVTPCPCVHCSLDTVLQSGHWSAAAQHWSGPQRRRRRQRRHGGLRPPCP